MANSYIAVPNVLPGNVTIGGNLTIAGDTLRVGSAAPYVRLQRVASGQLELNMNFDSIANQRDVATGFFKHQVFTTGNGAYEFVRGNSNNAAHTEALLVNSLTDYTNHANTGNTTENTIYTKTIRGGLLGANGALRVTVGLHVAVQGVTGTTVRVKLGATSFLVPTIAAADAVGEVIVQGVIFNQNNASIQAAHGFKYGGAGTTPCGDTAGAINTGNDAVFSVTSQSGSASDSQTFNFIIVEQVNTFGPVV